MMQLPPTDPTPSLRHVGILLAVCFFSFFIHNRLIPADLMEARNLATAREMTIYGNYLLPTMNGLPRYEKPPLPTWMAAAVEHVAPGNLAAQRAVAGLSATALVIFLYLLTFELTGRRRAALLAALVAATGVNVMLAARTATWDIHTHTFALGSAWLLAAALHRKRAQWGRLIGAGIMLGLSFMSKGPVSLYALYVPFVAAYAIAFHPSARGKGDSLTAMAVIASGVALWWFFYAQIAHSEAATASLQKETTAWMEHNVRPFYYYLSFPAEAGIWAVCWVTAILYFILDRRRRTPAERLAFIWFAASLVLLSLIPEKKTRYLLPLLVPGAMQIGLYFDSLTERISEPRHRIAFRINMTLIAAVIAAIPIALQWLLRHNGGMPIGQLIAAAAGCWTLAGLLLHALYARTGVRIVTAIGYVVAATIATVAICLPPIGQLFINPKRHSIALLDREPHTRQLPFYYNDADAPLRMELVYEARRRILPIDLTDTAALRQAAPFVLVSTATPSIADTALHTEPLGRFDNNWRHPDHKRYNPDLVKQATIIRRK